MKRRARAASSLIRISCICAVVLAASDPLLAQDTNLVRGRLLSTSSEVPLRGIGLHLVPLTGATFRTSAKSRQDGSFEFHSVPAGRYVVLEEEEITGYSRSNSLAGFDVAARGIEVRPGQDSSHVVIHLRVGAIIEGRVTGSDDEPIAGLQVSALQTLTTDRVPSISSLADDKTAADGTYQLTRVRAGTYSLAADITRPSYDGIETKKRVADDQREALVRTFYPGVPDAKSAKPVTVVEDQAVSGIDIQMRRGSVYSVRGVVVNAAPGDSYEVVVQRDLDVSTMRRIRIGGDRSFSIDGLLPGRYSLDLWGPTRNVLLSIGVLAHAEVEVTADDLEDVQLAIKPPLLVVARVTVKGVADTEPFRLYLRPTRNPTAPIVFSDRDSNGEYTFRTPDPEPNVLTVTGLPDGMTIQSVTFNGKPAADAVIDLSTGGGEIDVTVGPRGEP